MRYVGASMLMCAVLLTACGGGAFGDAATTRAGQRVVTVAPTTSAIPTLAVTVTPRIPPTTTAAPTATATLAPTLAPTITRAEAAANAPTPRPTVTARPTVTPSPTFAPSAERFAAFDAYMQRNFGAASWYPLIIGYAFDGSELTIRTALSPGNTSRETANSMRAAAYSYVLTREPRVEHVIVRASNGNVLCAGKPGTIGGC